IFGARAAAELQRKRYERDLAEEKERLAVTLRSIGDGCVAINNDGTILLMNPVAETLTGWPQEEAVGCQIGDVFSLIDERTRRPRRKALRRIVETGSNFDFLGPAVIVSRHETERIIETNAAPIRDPEDKKIGVVFVFRDITERHRIVEERQKAEKLESLGVAAGGIAHDFNNLLTAILGNLSLSLFRRDLDAETVERLTTAKKASLRAQDLAQQLLTFAKGGAPIKQTASVTQLIRDTVGFSLRGSNVRAEFQIPDDLWPADIDAGQISQVIQNLAINADQAMPAGGTLNVSCSNFELAADHSRLGLTPGRYLKISVKDEGIGIPESKLNKIFDPYFTTKPKGSGLGLATSYSIMKNHGGFIDVVSRPGSGTCFHLFLPASSNALPTGAEIISKRAGSIYGHPRSTRRKSRGTRVLVLDDEQAICALVTCALVPLGYEVVEAFDAASAIRIYAEAMDQGRRFDLVISDLTIPGGMGGREAVKRLLEIDPQVKAIVSSGYATDPVMSAYRDYGFCGMIAKPYEIEALGAVVADVLATPAPLNVLRQELTESKSA
ncbi:MAG: ATP-binding protein, partial [Chthoniobacteraceae bacterium]